MLNAKTNYPEVREIIISNVFKQHNGIKYTDHGNYWELEPNQFVPSGALYGCHQVIKINTGTTFHPNPFNLYPYPTPKSTVRRVLLAKSITHIDYEFDECPSLRDIRGDGVTSIETYAFSKCIALQKIILPLLTHIPSNAFEHCTSLVMADFPQVVSIDEKAFYNCTKLTTLDVPKIRSIDDSSFEKCPALMHVQNCEKH